MAVEQLRESTPVRADERLQEKQIDAGSGTENGQGRRKSILFASILGGVILVGALAFWLYSRPYESTDDAQVDGHLNGVTARIDGDVKAVYAEENQSIQAGDLLVELDPRDYEVAVEQAQAQLMKAQAGERAENPNLPITESTSQTSISTTKSEVANADAAEAAAERDQLAAQSRVAEAEANNARAQADVARYKSLVDRNEVSRSNYDQVVGEAKALAASLDSARASAEAAKKVVDQRRAQLDEARGM